MPEAYSYANAGEDALAARALDARHDAGKFLLEGLADQARQL
jgi:hypothetical protein